jgi:hypothetical protein
MHADEPKQTEPSPEIAQSNPRFFAAPKKTRKGLSSPPHNGLSFSRTAEDDVRQSMQAVGQVCRVAVIGVLLFGLGGGMLLGLLLF